MSAPVRVLLLTSTLGRGGAEKQLMGILEHADRGRVHPILLNLSRDPDEHWTPRARELLGEDYRQADPGAGHLRRAWGVRSTCREVAPAIVWGWHFFTSVYGVPVTRGDAPRLVVSMRNDGRYLLATHPWAPHLIRLAHAAVGNTAAVFRELGEVGVRLPRPAFVLPNFVETPPEPVRVRDVVTRVGFCGNMHPRKGIDVFLRAMAPLAGRSDVRVLLAGAGEAGPYVDLAHRLGLGDAFEHVGPVRCSEFVRTLDLLVLPSRHEGSPNVLLEAMASGVPAVAASVGGVPEVVEDGVTGLLVPPEDPEALRRAVRTLMGDAPGRTRMGRAAREAMTRRDARGAASTFADIVRTITGAPASA